MQQDTVKDQRLTAQKKQLAARVAELTVLHEVLDSCTTIEEKIAFLLTHDQVSNTLAKHPALRLGLQGSSELEKYVLLVSCILAGGSELFSGIDHLSDSKARFDAFVKVMITTESFYAYMGGVVGYHLKTLELIEKALDVDAESSSETLLAVPYIDIRKPSMDLATDLEHMIQWGILNQEQMAEVYVVGGAGERLGLKDEKTQTPLPVACLSFCGKTLLSGLVRDLEAREYLYFKLTGKQICTPILMMTSLEKDNDRQILAICEKEGYFARPKESIVRILQPLAPVLTIDGSWAVAGPLELVLKPAGHGVIWKLAQDSGAIDWLVGQGRKAMLVRQVNNPIAGIDHGLIALIGYGTHHNKAFGFESCPKKEGMTEGMNAVRCTDLNGKKWCTISNIEYTEFAKRKKQEHFSHAFSNSSAFPTNTNILYVDIQELKSATDRLQVPGLLVNMKHSVETVAQGKKVTTLGARLESTMQNIADAIVDEVQGDLKANSLRTFVLLNQREKTLSVTKKAFDGADIRETPEGCFYDLVHQNLALLEQVCAFTVPKPHAPEAQAIFLYHPALGPLYEVIAQKISGGRLHAGSELQLEIAEVFVRNLNVDGSLIIRADQVTGPVDSVTGLRRYADTVGAIRFENVVIKNKGRDRSQTTALWTDIRRHESCTIILQGFSECVAKDVCLEGAFELVVPDNTRAVLGQQADGSITVTYEPLGNSSRSHYSFDTKVGVRVSILSSK